MEFLECQLRLILFREKLKDFNTLEQVVTKIKEAKNIIGTGTLHIHTVTAQDGGKRKITLF
jgi:hypothetical protein